jgi:hypothetical protein
MIEQNWFSEYCFGLSGSRTLFLWINFSLVGAVPRDQTIDVIPIGSIGAKSLFVEKTFDPTTHTNLVGITVSADGPAHLAMPATPQKHDSSAGQSRCGNAQGPKPA